MSFHNVRLIRKLGLLDDAGLRSVWVDCCKGGGWSLDGADMQFQGPSIQNTTIIALLDRDSELRRRYLQRRWQGIIT
jgi:hypothetical protein